MSRAALKVLRSNGARLSAVAISAAAFLSLLSISSADTSALASASASALKPPFVNTMLLILDVLQQRLDALLSC